MMRTANSSSEEEAMMRTANSSSEEGMMMRTANSSSEEVNDDEDGKLIIRRSE